MSNKITLRNATHTVPAESADAGVDINRDRFEINIPALLGLLLRRRRWIVSVVGLAGVLTAVIMLLTPNRYTSTAVILPSGKSDSFSALKAITGLGAMLGGNDANSSTLFPVILGSHVVRDSLLSKTYDFTFDGEQMRLSLPEYLGIDDHDKQHRALSNITAVRSDARTGEITLAVETKYPELSRALVTEYLTQLETFNLFSRRSEAKERVRYLSRELETRERELRTAEDALEMFQSRNRNWAATSSPPLLKELVRLKREAEAKATTYAYLLQEYEVAKLDAQKDVPVVRILDPASLPTLKSGPHRTITVLAVAAVAFILVVLSIFAVDLFQQLNREAGPVSQKELAHMLAVSFPRTRRVYNRVRQRLEREAISVDK